MDSGLTTKGKANYEMQMDFHNKYKVDESIDRYKVRLVTKRYTQTYGVNYHETFSPVAKLDKIRVRLSLAANLDWPLHQFHIKTTFLHDDLKKELYMNIEPRYSTVQKKTLSADCKKHFMN